MKNWKDLFNKFGDKIHSLDLTRLEGDGSTFGDIKVVISELEKINPDPESVGHWPWFKVSDLTIGTAGEISYDSHPGPEKLVLFLQQTADVIWVSGCTIPYGQTLENGIDQFDFWVGQNGTFRMQNFTNGSEEELLNACLKLAESIPLR